MPYCQSLPVCLQQSLSGFCLSGSINIMIKLLIAALTFILFFLAYASNAPF